MARKYSKEEKIQYVEEYRASGLSLSQYAEETGIPKATIEDWIKEDDAYGFGEINIKPKAQEVPRVVKKTAVFANETVRIELKEGFNKEFVLKMVEVMVNC